MRINLLLKITLVALVLLGLSLRSAVSAGGSDEEVFPPKTLEKLKKNYSAKQQEKNNSDAVKGSKKSLKSAKFAKKIAEILKSERCKGMQNV